MSLSVKHYSSRSSLRLKVSLPISLFAAISIAGVVLYKFWLKRRKAQLENRATKNGDIFSIWNYDGKLAFEDIIKATKDFDTRYCIGRGGHGIVYRARLPNGKVIALNTVQRPESWLLERASRMRLKH